MKDGYVIYVDTGGTFTDSVIVSGDGSFVTGKAPTTPDKLDNCFFNSVEASAKEMGKSLRDVLSNVGEIRLKSYQ